MNEEILTNPPWLNAAVDQRLALIRESGALAAAGVGGHAVIMTTLTEPPPDPTPEQIEEWERGCDNCRAYTPKGDIFYPGRVEPMIDGVLIVITFGMCRTCKDLCE